MQVDIINIGDELLIGQVVNTNAAWMAQALNDCNINVRSTIVVADEAQAIEEAIALSLAKVDAVLITGGLGPTKDDITKQVLCHLTNDTLTTFEAQLNKVKEYFATRSLPLTPLNEAQALVPSHCHPVLNEVGTAPCMIFEIHQKLVICMPGVPFEMQWLMKKHILAMLSERAGTKKILHRTVHTFGIGESFLADKISDWEASLPPHIHLAYLPQAGKVRLRLSAYGSDSEVLTRETDALIERLEKIIPNNIYGYDDDTIASAVGRALKERNATVATAESCTAGLVARTIAEVPGASAYLKGGAITYCDEIKHSLLGVDDNTLQLHTAVSEDTAIEMAEKARILFGTTYAVATTGYSGPDPGTETNPRGTVYIAVADASGTSCHKYNFQTLRTEHQSRSANQALFDLYTHITR